MQSTTAAMTVIDLQYAAFGLPSDLTSADRDVLLDRINALFYSLSTNPPPDVDAATLEQFLQTLKQMWSDLDGIPSDLAP